MRRTLKGGAPDEFEARLRPLLKRYSNVISVCLLDLDGVQRTETLINGVAFLPEKTVIFAPPPLGTDHSFREYFYLLLEGSLDPFVTAPYVRFRRAICALLFPLSPKVPRAKSRC
jgi:hypothetical protein